jgi:hypothetical protein
MPLKVLCAGCSKDERESAEAAVRKALAAAPPGSWTVSLVKIQRQWSVSLHGPGHNLTFTAPDGGIRESIAEALRKGAGGAGAPPSPPARAAARAQPPAAPAVVPGEQRDRHQCQKCALAFVVVYAASANASQERVAAACPHCWHVNYVMVGDDAAWNRDYRVEKAD